MTTDTFTNVHRLREQYGDDIVIVEPSGDDLDSPERINKQLAEGVKRGQLWMARDAEGQFCYVLITSVCDDPRMASVIPLSNDPQLETADALVIEQGAPLDEPMVAWPELKAIIPVRLLYKPLKDFAPATVNAIETNDPAKADPADTVRQGNDPQDEDSSTFDDRDDIAFTLVLWHAKCGQLPELNQLEHQDGQTGEDLESYNQALKDVLGLSASVRLAVMRGDLGLNRTQQGKMERAGFPAAPKKSEAIPDEYLIMAEQPEWYRAAERINPENPELARQELGRKAAYGLAARTTGNGEQAMRGAFLKAAEQLLREQGKEL